MLTKLVIEYFKHKDAFILDEDSCLDEKLRLQTNFHVAEQALRHALPPNQEVSDLCSCGEPWPFASPRYDSRCKICSLIIPEQD